MERLQELRKALRGLQRTPRKKIFGPPRDETWTFHAGGRGELQCNLGFEDPIDGRDFRFGVAFSFEHSRSLPDLASLERKVLLFKDYLREKAEEFADLRMWHHDENGRSSLRRPGPIEDDLFRFGVFVFLGDLGISSNRDPDHVVNLLERLFPLWRFIEENAYHGEGDRSRGTFPDVRAFSIIPGRPSRNRIAWATRRAQVNAIDLRHNGLWVALYDELVIEHGHQGVGVEQDIPGGRRLDLIAGSPDYWTIYEIKTAATARGCIREALGQLL